MTIKTLPAHYGRLALTRKEGQAITIALPDGEFLRIIHNGNDRGVTKLTFEAPREVNIVRDEVLARKTEH